MDRYHGLNDAFGDRSAPAYLARSNSKLQRRPLSPPLKLFHAVSPAEEDPAESQRP